MLLEELWKKAGLAVLLEKEKLKGIEINKITDDTRLINSRTLFAVTNLAKPYLHLLEKNKNKPAAIFMPAEEKLAYLPSFPILTSSSFLMDLGKVSSSLYDFPAKSLKIYAVTGTNGKTSIAWLLYNYWLTLGYRAGMIGTLGCYYNDGEKSFFQKTGYTTPRSWQLQELLLELKKRKIFYVALEASSEGIDLGRIHGLKIDIAIFTGLSQDHLDHHKDMESYYQAKKKLFTLAKGYSAKFIIGAGDSYGKRLAKEENLYPHRYVATDQDVEKYKCMKMMPDFHRKNIFLSALALNSDNSLEKKGLENSLAVLQELPLAPGRFEKISPSKLDWQNKIFAIVDYAHTPEALEKLLANVQKQAKTIVCVFGCGGERDKGKRSKMGKVVTRYSDCIYVCDDNPRNEDPSSIRKQIISAFPKFTLYYEIPDRALAIKKAIDWGKARKEGPIAIVVAGKGHENYQIYKKEKRYFSDQDVVRNNFNFL